MKRGALIGAREGQDKQQSCWPMIKQIGEDNEYWSRACLFVTANGVEISQLDFAMIRHKRHLHTLQTISQRLVPV
ncbi:MAG: hypothetical protein Fur0021_05830 [Candidatus Promineifilaceae bacterium]